ncbi:MAG: MFS transporter [Oscillospiraceae bacterium]|jgi:melibiose permease/lactose/raffinose/galactose permease|nr:MFS transporter [Oscillospiraceae bacterium]
MEQPNNRMPKRNLWMYSLTSLGRDTATFLFSGFLMTYVLYTKNLTNLQYTVVSILMVAARVFDGFNDPVMGNIIEVTRTKWGKFKPWIVVGMAFSAIVYLVSFTNTLTGWNYVVLYGVLYFIYSIVFTMNDIAYWGMIPSLAAQKTDRDTLTSRTVFFAGAGAGITGVAAPIFTAGSRTIGGSAVTAYAVLAFVFSGVFLGSQLLTLLGVKEKPLPPKGAATINSVGIGTVVRTIKGNDQLLWCMIIFLMAAVGNGLIGGGLGGSYIYFEFGYNGMLYTLFSSLGAVVTGLIMLFFAPISKRIPRQKLARIAMVCAIGGYLFMLAAGMLAPRGMIKYALLIVGNLFAFAGQNIFYLILMISFANTVEYNEWKTGARAEGIIFSVRPFITKVATALIQLTVMVIFLITGVLEFTNQISDLEQAAAKGLSAAAKTQGIESVIRSVPASKSAALLACMTLIPIALAVVSFLLYRVKYTISEERYDELLVALNERREQAQPTS